MKRLIVITTPYFFPGEGELLTILFDSGLQHLHLRKPDCSPDQLKLLIDTVPSLYHSRIILHECFELTAEYPLIGGVHLNRRNPVAPEGFPKSISRSCHSLQEVADGKGYDYQFLSPLFPSISKEGYGEGYTMDELRKASGQGVINNKVIALGGMDATTIPRIQEIPFGGVAVLGAVWGKSPSPETSDSVLNEFKRIQSSI